MYYIVLLFIATYNLIGNIEPTIAKHVLSVFDWSGCSSTEFELRTIPLVSIKHCAQYCKAEPNCERFNYYTSRKTCELLQQQGGQTVHVSNRPCVTVLRTDIDQTLTCDAGDDTCARTECPIASVDNADVEGNVQSVGSKAKVTCKPQYQMATGRPRITCNQDGTWANIPTCTIQVQVVCQNPPTQPFTSISPGTNAALEVRTYSCVQGKAFDPNGGSTITTTCTIQQTWTATSFTCITDCGQPDPIENATLQAGPTVVSSSRTYSCKSGFLTTFGTTVLQVTCQQSGVWTTPAAYCVRDCGEPDPITNANLAVGGTTDSEVRTYTCKSGFMPSVGAGSFDVTCQSDGTWISTSVTCIPVVCQNPPSQPFTNISPGTNAALEVRTYSCVQGKAFDPNGGSTITTTCTIQQTWTATSFTCITDCGNPDPIENATLQNGPTVVSNSRTYNCKSGFLTTFGTTVLQVTCQQNGAWTTPAAYCVRGCGEPDLITNANLAAGGTTDSAVRSYTCKTGFMPSVGFGSFDVNCQGDGTWTTTSITCVASCGLPPSKPNSNNSPTGMSEGSTATYTCNSNFIVDYNNNRVSNTHVVTCTSGSWTDVNFMCVLACPLPSDSYQVIGTQKLKLCLIHTTKVLAEDACSLNGKLVKVDTVAKHTAILNHLDTNRETYTGWNFWIQGKLNTWLNKWQFDDYTDIPNLYWQSGITYQKNNALNCLEIHDLSYWDDINCDKLYGYICEKP